MTGDRYLIVNADDFGLCDGVNRGTVEAHENGIVTSASLMARWPAAAAAAAYACRRPRLSLGLHVDLGEWAYRGGRWVQLYEVVPVDDRAAVEREVGRQLDLFRSLAGRDPTHLDSHQHVHLKEPVRSVLAELAARLRVPLRDGNPAVRYCGDFYGQTAKGWPFPEGIEVGGLVRLLDAQPPGVTELGCHPGYAEGLDSMYVRERAEEVRTLCDPRVRGALAARQIRLVSFADLPGEMPAPDSPF
jgi:chitin disaccharide deacetylase